MKLTNKEFKKRVYDQVGDEYTFLEKYGTNRKEKLLCRHNSKKCNYNEWYISPNNFIYNGRRCNVCFKQKVRFTNNEFKKKVYDQVGDEYTFLEKYQDIHTKLLCRHNSKKCNYN